MESSMISSNSDVQGVWIRIFALLSIAMILANAQCYASCTGGIGNLPSAASHCHRHHKSSDGDPSPCPFQHSQFSAPEPGIAKVNPAANDSFVITAISGDLGPAVNGLQSLPRFDTGPPRDLAGRSMISVLRV